MRMSDRLLAGGNTYSGGTTINGGIVKIAGDFGLGLATAPLAINNNATLQASAVVANTRPITLGVGGGKIDTNGNNVTLGATSSVTGTTLTKIGAGTLTINGTQSYAALVTNAGTTTLNTALGTGNSTVTANAATHFTVSQNLADVTVNNGALVRLTQHNSPIKHIDTSTLHFAGTGTLDLTDNSMIVRTQTLAAVNALLVTGYNAASGYWDGPGINSSTAASEPNGLTALGVLDNAEYGYTDFAGVTGLLGTEILVKYTWIGDADLNGVVNGDDFTQFAFGFNGGAAEWLNGDFDYNGVVNGDDFTLFAAGFNGQTGPLRPGEAAAVSAQLENFAQELGGGSAATATGSSSSVGQAVVPEPGSVALLAAGALGLLGRRRRTARRA